MDLPSMVSDFTKMTVAPDHKDAALDRTDSAAPVCSSPSIITLESAQDSFSQDRAIPESTSESNGRKTSSSRPLWASRSQTVSAYKKPSNADTINTPSSHGADSSDSDSASASKSPLKATAPAFVPTPPGKPRPNAPEFTPSSLLISTSPSPLSRSPIVNIRASARGGTGVHAAQNIPMGTRIICETPLLKIPSNDLHNAWYPYTKLDVAQKQAYDSLYFWDNSDLRLEQASRMYLLDPTEHAMETEEEEKQVANHVRVMSVFAVNNFLMSNGELGIFATAARLNHACVPNVHHSYNSTMDKLIVHAVRDIREGEELLMNYIGAECHFWTHNQRWDYLRSKYGFTCQCEACSDTTGFSDNRHEMLPVLIWGIQQYQKGEPRGDSVVIPGSADQALAQVEDIITLLLEQGLLAVELTRAYRLAASIALDMGDYQKALEYASNEAEVERNIFGTELDDLKQSGTASELWIKQMYRTLKIQGYKPYRSLAVKIFQITGLRHEMLYEKQSPKKGTYKRKNKRASPKKQASPSTQGGL